MAWTASAQNCTVAEIPKALRDSLEPAEAKSNEQFSYATDAACEFARSLPTNGRYNVIVAGNEADPDHTGDFDRISVQVSRVLDVHKEG